MIGINLRCNIFSILVSHSNYAGSDVPMAPSKEQQTLMWQQNSYLVDSGINSGAATQVNVHISFIA